MGPTTTHGPKPPGGVHEKRCAALHTAATRSCCMQLDFTADQNRECSRQFWPSALGFFNGPTRTVAHLCICISPFQQRSRPTVTAHTTHATVYKKIGLILVGHTTPTTRMMAAEAQPSIHRSSAFHARVQESTYNLKLNWLTGRGVCRHWHCFSSANWD